MKIQNVSLEDIDKTLYANLKGTTVQCCHNRNGSTRSFLNVITTVSTDFSKTFISNELTKLIQPIVRGCDNVLKTPLCLLNMQIQYTQRISIFILQQHFIDKL